ncbi:uncharacterized protein LOC108808433 [Raphanus sativus]|uniref:Uncharacterized protein LOC108808433 n=1 Tax=Raphanus sativus TaxID=3726 RepID=A0A9W3BVE1_RAPSA|nr:uncharacterized protein LOC108808433 [Raphanus sativus]
MASQSKPGPLTPAEYKALMKLRGVPYEAVIDYPNGDAQGNLSFTQITPTFWRYVLATFVRAREEGLEFGLAELKQLYTLKRSSGITGAFLLSPRSGLSIITDIPGKDFYWTDKFFVFKVDPHDYLLGFDLDFFFRVVWILKVDSRTAWSDLSAPPSVVPIALVEPIRPRKDKKGVKRKDPPGEPSDANSDSAPSKRARETPDKRVTRASSQIQSPIVQATPLSVVRPGRDVPLDSRASGEVDVEEVAPKVQRRRLILDEESSKGFNVSSSEPLMQDPGEGISKPVNLPADYRSGSPLAFSYDVDAPILEDPERFAAIWRKLRSSLCALPLLEQMRGRDAYVQMAIANAKAREQERTKQVIDLKVLLTAKATEKVALEEEKIVLEKEKVVLGKEKVTMEADLESLKAKFRRDAELRERVARRERRAACRLVAKGYDAALDKARETIRQRRAESTAEMRLQEVRPKIEALAEYLEGGFELEEELDHLKDVEISTEIEYGLTAVSDDSLRGLDLP